jgi:glyceraldehyde-3-phosphate dehydrogenase (NAD(P))
MGVQICTPLDHPEFVAAESVIPHIDYVFDCTANGMGLRHRDRYDEWPRLQGACTQGSEKGFGVPFMTGLNGHQIVGERYVQVVSCNTHGLAALIQMFTGAQVSRLRAADFVVVRRSEDLGAHAKLVSAHVVSRHLDAELGTHHAIDVKDLYATLGVSLSHLASSDITTPSQLMHGVRFHLQMQGPLEASPDELIARYPYGAVSHKFDSNVIFDWGRRIGVAGRIYAHAIVISNNLLIQDDAIKGWAFIPQEGCTLLSTVHAYLLQTRHPDAENVMQALRQDLLRPIW